MQSVFEIDNLDARYISVSSYQAIQAINDARVAAGITGVDGILNLGNLDSMNLNADQELEDNSTLSANERAEAIDEIYTSEGFL